MEVKRMEVENKYASPLKMKNLCITEAVLHFAPEFRSNKLKINVRRDKKYNEETGTYIVILGVKVFEESEKVVVKVVCQADFSVNGESLPKNIADTLLEKNSISIMFPYVRSYITTITSVPNMIPIVIPPINVNKLIEDSEKERG